MCRFSTVHAPRCVSPALDGQGQVTPGKADRLLGSGANDGRRNEENRRDSSMAARCGATGKAQADFLEPAGAGGLAFAGKRGRVWAVFRGGSAGVGGGTSFPSARGFFCRLSGSPVPL